MIFGRNIQNQQNSLELSLHVSVSCRFACYQVTVSQTAVHTKNNTHVSPAV